MTWVDRTSRGLSGRWSVCRFRDRRAPARPQVRQWLRIRWGIALGALFFLSCGDLARSGSSHRPGPEFDWGLYQIYWGPQHFERMLDESLQTLASSPGIIMFYRDLGRGFPAAGCQIIDQKGAVPALSLELWHWGGRHRGRELDLIVDGAYDQFFRDYARDARDYGKPVYLRFGFEMNGDWFSWGNRPESFISAWRHAYRIFDAEGAENVLWVWSPNYVSIPRENNPIEAYYPGDEFVDWVGVDGYNFGDSHSPWHRWESFSEVFDPALALFEEHYPGKPVMIAEFGSAPGEGSSKADWIRDAYEQIRERRQIHAAIWFHLDKRREGEPNWRIDSDPGSLDAFNGTFARPER